MLKIYDIFIAILAGLATIIAIIDLRSGLSPALTILDNLILIIFVLDYFIRLFLSKDKKVFVKSNILDLIAIIPFNSAFRIFRLAKIIKITKLAKLSRLFAFSFRLSNRLKRFFDTNGFKYMLLISGSFILLGAVAIHFAENMTLEDSIWWAFVTTTTVGYGDISPSTITGRFVAMVLMVVGIGLLGSLTSTITSYFLNPPKDENIDDKIIKEIQCELNHIKDLSDDDIDKICAILKTLNKRC